MCPQAASFRHHAYPALDTSSPFHKRPARGLERIQHFRKALYLWGACMCVFPHLLCTLSTRKIRIKFILHCFLHLGVVQARRKLAWKPRPLQQQGAFGVCPLGKTVWPVQIRGDLGTWRPISSPVGRRTGRASWGWEKVLLGRLF